MILENAKKMVNIFTIDVFMPKLSTQSVKDIGRVQWRKILVYEVLEDVNCDS